MHGGGGHALWQGDMRGIQRDTVNERAVRILLECILVLHNFLERFVCKILSKLS